MEQSELERLLRENAWVQNAPESVLVKAKGLYRHSPYHRTAAERVLAFLDSIPISARIILACSTGLMLLAVIVSTGYAVTLDAIPTDRDYPVKRAFEAVEIALAPDEGTKLSLHVHFARERVNEAAKLIYLGNHADAVTAIQEYRGEVKEVNQIIEDAPPSMVVDVAPQVITDLKGSAATIQNAAEPGSALLRTQVAHAVFETTVVVSRTGAALATAIAYVRSTPTPLPTSTPQNTRIPTSTTAPTNTAVPTPEISTATPQPTAAPTDIPTDIPTPAPTDVPTPAPTDIPTDIPTDVPTDAPTQEVRATVAPATPVPTATAIPTDVPTSTPQPTDTPRPTRTPAPTDTPTATQTPTYTPTPTDTPTDEPTPTATNTDMPTPTDTPTDAPTDTPTPTATDTPVPTDTWTPLPTETYTPQPTDTPTDVPTSTPRPTKTPFLDDATPTPDL